jgi:Ras-related protein Rab-8A
MTTKNTTNYRDPSVVMLKKRNKNDPPVLKILVIGDSGVGKSCLLLRFASDTFQPSYMPTIGIDFRVKDCELEGRKAKVQVWDTAGQDRFYSITRAYYRGAHGVMIVYDVTDPKSFRNVERWMRSLDTHASESVNRVLIANKSDVHDKRVIDTEKGRALAEKYGVKFFEVSAKSGDGVEDAFETLAVEIKHRVLDSRSADTSDSSGDEDGQRKNSSGSLSDSGDTRKGPCCGL